MAAESGADTMNLASVSEETVVKNLGKLTESLSCRFTCGGELTSPDKIQLVYGNRAGELKKMVLPGASEADIQQLLEACSVASFGLDDQLVTDTNYRNALKLDPDNFTTSFQVASTPILHAAMTMMPNVQGVQAELYKLNIYSSGGFFKAHVDTPRSEKMFGSLVVCLPTQFSGGELVTRHNRHTVKFDWSSPPDSPRQTTSWAMFFSDVEHEILPVSEGHRITLTYNLYAMEAARDVPSHDITINPLYKELSAALGHPHFKRDGGVLGFACHHKYVYTDLNSTPSLPRLLKGADQIVYSVAKSLGLSVIVKPVLSYHWRRSYPRILLKHFPKYEADIEDIANYMYHYSYNEKDSDGYGEASFNRSFTRCFEDGHHVKHITWCQNFDDSHEQVAGCIGTYGNEPVMDVFYQNAAVLVGIPKWGECRKNCGLGSSQETQEKERLESESKEILEKFCFHGEMPDEDY